MSENEDISNSDEDSQFNYSGNDTGLEDDSATSGSLSLPTSSTSTLSLRSNDSTGHVSLSTSNVSISVSSTPASMSAMSSTSTSSRISNSSNLQQNSLNLTSVSEMSVEPNTSSNLSLASDISTESTTFTIENVEDEDLRYEWLFNPLYEGTDTLNGEILCKILDIHISSASTKQVLDKAINLVASTLPPGASNFPKTRYFVLKLVNQLMPHSFSETFIRHRICDMCFTYLGILDVQRPIMVCNVCPHSNVNGLVMQFSIEAAIQDAFEVGNLHRFIDDYEKDCAKHQEEIIYDITSGEEFKRLKCTAIPGKYDLCLIWNADGIPTDDDNGQLWALQAQIANVSPRSRRRFQITCALYYSNKKSKHKPEMGSFLKPFVQENRKMFKDKVHWKHKETGVLMESKVIAPVATMDAPAKAASMETMQYNGSFGCSTCEHPGKRCRTGNGFNRVFPLDEEEYTLRTKKRILDQARKAIFTGKVHVKGVKSPSITFLLPHFDPSKGFVPDYMHAVPLGVLKMLLFLWFASQNKDKPFYVSKSTQQEIDKLMCDVKPEDKVTRTPRSLDVMSHWKASELRAFLLFYGPILLRNKLEKKYYDHFLLFVRAIHILLQSSITKKEVDLAETYLYMFVQDVEELYALEKCSYNVHQLLHLSRYVRLWGPLWAWSAFPFEDGNGYLVRMAHGTKNLEVELANTMHFRNALRFIENLMQIRVDEREYNGIAIGANVEFKLTESHEAALRKTTGYSQDELKQKRKLIYQRIKLRNEKYTSIQYIKETKRINYCIYWNGRKKFGCIQFYVKIDDSLFAIVRELIKVTNQDLQIKYSKLDIRFNDIFIPVRDSLIIHALPIKQIEGKVVYVHSYVCFLPNEVERK